MGRTTKYVYDLAGQLTSVKSAFGTADAGTVSYTYDADGRQKTITDETNQITGLHTTNTYDPAGRLISVQDPLGNLTSYGYDADGRKISVTEPNNQAAGLSTTYTYDLLDRLLSKVPDSTLNQHNVVFTYTATGQRLSMTDVTGATNYTQYDNRDHLLAKTSSEGNLNYTYDAMGIY